MTMDSASKKSGYYRTYQRRAYVSKAGYARLDAVLRGVCTLYNAALEDRRNAWSFEKLKRTKNQQKKVFTDVRKDDPEGLGSVNTRLVVDSALERLDRAFQAFFRRVKAGKNPGYPRFKPWRRFRTLEARAIEAAWVRTPGQLRINGLPVIRFCADGLPDGQPVSLKLTRSGCRLTLSLTYLWQPPEPAPTGGAVGIDRGVTWRAALSTGELAPSLADPKADADIRRKQRRLSRCKKFSRQWRKRRAILARAQEKRAVRRKQANHRLTTDIARRFSVIAVEDLKIGDMTHSAKGDAENPGRRVRQKAGLNRGILTQGWGQILQQLDYKAEWAGGQVVRIPAPYTSQTCAACGVIDPASRNRERFECVACGHRDHADVNAAKNIRRLGLKALGQGETWAAPPPSLDGPADFNSGRKPVQGRLDLGRSNPPAPG